MPPAFDLAATESRFALSDAVLVAAIERTLGGAGRPVLVGLAGAQGSGKSTTAQRLAARLAASGRTAVVRSLDDFYLPLAQRCALARTVHPLLLTRGVPGTHDLPLMAEILARLLGAGDNSVVPLPAFDKLADDRMAPARWTRHEGPVDVCLIEGWCMGARPQPAAALDHPLNDLERDEDRDGLWRRYVNDQLASGYADLFGRFDLMLMLKAPGFACVPRWRAEQEATLLRDGGRREGGMDAAQLTRFIAHYERLTRWQLDDEPADLIVELDAERQPCAWRIGQTRHT